MSNEQASPQYKIDLNATFSEIASKSLFFIDKSLDAIKLLQLNSNRVMVLRPPKFGKSVMMDMIEDYFLQRTESFQKLKCQVLLPVFGITFSKDKASTVIRFKLKTNEMTKDNYNEIILGEIKKQFINHNVSGFERFLTPNSALEYLIAELSSFGQKKIVILIDDIESILLSMKYNSTEFLTLVANLQSIFDVIHRWKDSIKYLLLLGSANFCQVTNIVRDFTFRYETAGIFGFNITDMINSNIFFNQVGDSIRLPETKVHYFGTLQRTLQYIYDFSVSNFNQIIQTNLSGKISIEFLFYLILHSGNHIFAPMSKVFVINPIDFLLSMSESRIGTYWMNMMLKEYPNTFFLAFPDGEETVEKWLLKVVTRGNMLLPEDIPNYKALIPFGFLSFKNETIVIPNLTLLEFTLNTSVRCMYSRCLNDYTSIGKSPFNTILAKMPNFPEYKILPSIVFKSSCWDFIMFFYLYHIFPNIKIQVANDGTFLIIGENFILSFFFKGDLDNRLSTLERETTVPIILFKITITNCISVETCFRQENQILKYKLDLWNPNFFFVTTLFPFLYTDEEIQKAQKNSNNKNENNDGNSDNNNANSNQKENESENENVGEKEEEKEEKVDPNKLFSFSDVVKESLRDLSKRKGKYITARMILNDIVKKMPHFASDSAIDKSILLSLFYLSKTGYVEYRSNDLGVVEYSLVQYQSLKKISS